MVKNYVRVFLLMILLAALPVASLAQDVKTLLNSSSKAMGVENLKSLHFSGSGSTYKPGDAPTSPRTHEVMKSYVRDLDVEKATSRVQITRLHGTPPADQVENRVVDTNSDWLAQSDYWLTPYAFLKGAMANNATVESKSVNGVDMKIVTFSLQNRKVVGYFNDKDLIERVETWVDDPVLGKDTLVEAYYSDYTDFGGVKVPTTIFQKTGGSLSLLMIVKEVKPNGAASQPVSSSGGSARVNP